MKKVTVKFLQKLPKIFAKKFPRIVQVPSIDQSFILLKVIEGHSNQMKWNDDEKICCASAYVLQPRDDDDNDDDDNDDDDNDDDDNDNDYNDDDDNDDNNNDNDDDDETQSSNVVQTTLQ